MTFPLDPGMREFFAKCAEHVERTDEPVPPEGFQAEEGEHAVLTPAGGPSDAEVSPREIT